MAANCHPDHDTISRSGAAPSMGGGTAAGSCSCTVSPKVDANANKRNSIRYDRACASSARRDRGVVGSGGARRLPEELSRRDKLRAKLDRACAELERRAQARADSERAEYERKVAARARRTGSRKGRHIKPPGRPEAKAQINLTDASADAGRHHDTGPTGGCRRQSVGVGVAGDVRERPQRVGGGPILGRGGSGTADSLSQLVALWRCWWRRGRKAAPARLPTGAAGAAGGSRRRTGSSRCRRRWHCRSSARLRKQTCSTWQAMGGSFCCGVLRGEGDPW